MSPAPGCSRLSKACDQLEHDVGVAPARLHGRARARSPRPRHDRVARSRIATGADGVFLLLARRVVVGEVDDTIALAAPDVQPDPRVAEGRQRERLHPGPARLIPARELPVQRGSGAVLREAARERGRQSGEARGRGAPRVDQPVREQPPYALAETHRGPLRAPSHVVVPRVGRTEDDRPAIARPRALVGIPQERALPVQAVEKLGQERGGRELGVVGRRAEDGEDNEHGIGGQPVGDPTDRRVHRAVDVVEPRPVSPGHGQPRHRMPGVENVPEVLAGGVGLRHDGEEELPARGACHEPRRDVRTSRAARDERPHEPVDELGPMPRVPVLVAERGVPPERRVDLAKESGRMRRARMRQGVRAPQPALRAPPPDAREVGKLAVDLGSPERRRADADRGVAGRRQRQAVLVQQLAPLPGDRQRVPEVRGRPVPAG